MRLITAWMLIPYDLPLIALLQAVEVEEPTPELSFIKKEKPEEDLSNGGFLRTTVRSGEHAQ